jgi:hypothetical protein
MSHPFLRLRFDDRPGRRRDPEADATLLRFVRESLGDPRLTWWEANFLEGMKAWVAPEGPGASCLTRRQWEVLAQLSAKLEALTVEEEAIAALDE